MDGHLTRVDDALTLQVLLANNPTWGVHIIPPGGVTPWSLCRTHAEVRMFNYVGGSIHAGPLAVCDQCTFNRQVTDRRRMI